MISYLRGKILNKSEKSIVIDSNGIGFQVFVNSDLLSSLPKIGEEAEIYCSLAIRQDTLELFGFRNIEQLEFFHLLTSVSGVGPKTALSILGLSSVSTLKAAIVRGEPELLTKVSGIGKKTAERIIVDLRTKIAELPIAGPVEKLGENVDVMEVLMTFGYNRSQINEAMSKIDPEISGASKKIKELLKILGQQK